MRRGLLVLVVLACGACHRITVPPPVAWAETTVEAPLQRNLRDTCVRDADPTRDYFPEKAAFRHSSQLEVVYHPTYKVVTFTPAVDTREVLRYALVQCGTTPPPGFDDAHTVEVPIRRFATAHHSILSTVTRLGLEGRLAGVANRRSITEPTIRRLAMDRQLPELGSGTHSSIEATIAVQPDVYFTFYSAYPQSNLHPQLWQMGVRALPMADHMEPTPLGRSDWLLFLALLTNQEGAAVPYLAQVEREYRALADRTRDVSVRPVVITGRTESRDTWDLPGHRNQLARLIHDAGGRYFFDRGGSSSYVRADYERTLWLAAPADAWVGGPNRIGSIGELLARDARHAWLRPVRRGHVWALDAGGESAWTYPYVDQSLDRPHVVLADLIRALHPDRLPDHADVFTRRLE